MTNFPIYIFECLIVEAINKSHLEFDKQVSKIIFHKYVDTNYHN